MTPLVSSRYRTSLELSRGSIILYLIIAGSLIDSRIVGSLIGSVVGGSSVAGSLVEGLSITGLLVADSSALSFGFLSILPILLFVLYIAS
jgi:hypothetical protein